MHTPQTPSQFDRSNSIDIDNPAGNGLGNLADELADAWSEGEEEEEEEDDDPDLDFHHGNDDGHETENDTGTIEASHRHEEEIRDSGIDVGNAESPGEKVAASGRQERNGTYDGTTGRDDSDLESRLPPALEARIDTLESFVRRGWEDGGSGNDGVVQRVVQDLRDLGGQSGVENAATRYVLFKRTSTSSLMKP